MNKQVKPSIVIFRDTFAAYSETFVYETIRKYENFTPFVFTKKRINHNLFPFDNVFVPGNLKGRKLEAWLFAKGIKSSAIARQFAHIAPKLAHAHFGQSGILALPYIKKFRVPLVVSLHGNDVGTLLGNQKLKPTNWVYWLSLRRLVRGTSLFLAASNELKDRFVELGCPAEKIRVHRLGIDLSLFKSHPRPAASEKTVTIMMIGRLVEKKGFEYGIRAFAETVKQLTTAGITMKIVGSGPLEHKLKALVARIGLSENVTFVGTLSHEQIRDALKNTADILLAPSVVARNKDRDSGLMVAKEAAACSLPVIGSRHGGIPDIIDDGKTGYLVPERDFRLLAERLAQLVTDENLRRHLGQAARAKMEKEYDIDEHVAQLESIYLELIESGAGSTLA